MSDNVAKMKNAGVGELGVTVISDPGSLVTEETYASSGCEGLNLLISPRGGFPFGRFTELIGDNSSGKSLFCIQACVNVINAGGIAVYIDPEAATNLDLLRKMGVDLDSLFYYIPDNLSDLFKFIDGMIEAKNANLTADAPMIIIWDSVSASTTAEEMAKDPEDRQYSTAAIAISRKFRTGWPKVLRRSNVSIVMVNQLRSSMSSTRWPGKENRYGGVVDNNQEFSTFGGMAVSYYSSLRVLLHTKTRLDDNGIPTGAIINAKVIKNRMGAPFRSVDIPIMYGLGTDDDAPLFDLLLTYHFQIINGTKYSNFIQKGAWYTLHLPGREEIKFQKKKFGEILDQYYDEILQVLEANIHASGPAYGYVADQLSEQVTDDS